MADTVLRPSSPLKAYLKASLDLIPLDGKRPIHQNWTNRDYRDFDAVRWLESGRNVGVRLPDDMLVIDWDPRADTGKLLWGVPSYDELILSIGADPDDWPTVRTGGGGLHHYLRKPAGLKLRGSLKDYPGIEIKSIGQQVVAAGSLHPETLKIYEWEGFVAPPIWELPDAPEGLLELFARTSGVEVTGGGEHESEEIAAMLAALEPENFRNHEDWLTLMQACHHASGGEAREEFVDWSTGDPAYAGHSEIIRRRWDSLHADNDGGARITHRTLYKILMDHGAGDAIPRPSAQEDFEDDLPEGDAEPNVPKPWPRRLVYEQKHGAKNARFFLRQRPAPIIYVNELLYSYADGIWHETAEAALRAEIRETDPVDVLDENDVAKVIRGIRDLSTKTVQPFEWITPPGEDLKPADLALFGNGLLHVPSNSLVELDGAYFATGLPGYGYDPSAKCPAWMRFLDETLDPSFHATLQEWMGYTMTADIRAHKFLCLFGVRRGGKSTVLEVNQVLVGSQHTVSAAMADLGTDFGLENSLDKRLLVIPDAHDAPARTRSMTLERLKSITGADHVSVNRKHKSIVSTQLPTRILVVSNKLPKFIDESGALASRMLIVKFETSFEGKEDRDMRQKLLAELPGIANWALEGLRRLRSNGLRFTLGDKANEEIGEAERSQSPALRFSEDCLEVTGDENDFAPIPEIYRAYRLWAEHTEGIPRAQIRNQTDLKDDLCAALRKVKWKQRRIKRRQRFRPCRRSPGDFAGDRHRVRRSYRRVTTWGGGIRQSCLVSPPRSQPTCDVTFGHVTPKRMKNN